MAESEKRRIDFINAILQHEGLVPLQTPFRITDPKMANWVSMFDDTIRTQLDPNAIKPKDRQNFLFLKNQADLIPAVAEQFRRYRERNPNWRIIDAIRKFDQTGSKQKLNFLKEQGFNPEDPISSVV